MSSVHLATFPDPNIGGGGGGERGGGGPGWCRPGAPTPCWGGGGGVRGPEQAASPVLQAEGRSHLSSSPVELARTRGNQAEPFKTIPHQDNEDRREGSGGAPQETQGQRSRDFGGNSLLLEVATRQRGWGSNALTLHGGSGTCASAPSPSSLQGPTFVRLRSKKGPCAPGL